MKELSPAQIHALRTQLQKDADLARSEPDSNRRTEWLQPERWSRYMGPEGKQLYQSYSDTELLQILQAEAARLGRVPAQHEVFCVYRDYIRRRFGNWIKALRAAELRQPKQATTDKG